MFYDTEWIKPFKISKLKKMIILTGIVFELAFIKINEWFRRK